MHISLARLRQFAHDQSRRQHRFASIEIAQVLNPFQESGIFREIFVTGSVMMRRQFPYIRNQLFAQRRTLSLKGFLSRDLFRRWDFEDGPVEIVALSLARNFINIIEVREKLIELFLRDRIKLVIVTAGAPESEPEKGGTGRGYPIYNRFHAILLEVDTTLIVAGRIAMKAGGDQLVDAWIRQHVARDLLDHELIERHVTVQSVDHPVAVLPHLAWCIDGVTVGIGVARHVEPVAAPSLAVVRRSEQPVDDAFVGVRARIGYEIANLLG